MLFQSDRASAGVLRYAEKLSSATKSPRRSSTLCSRIAASGAARNRARTRNTMKSPACPARSAGSTRWRIATAISAIEKPQAIRQDAQPQAAAWRERLLGKEVERKVDRQRLLQAAGGD